MPEKPQQRKPKAKPAARPKAARATKASKPKSGYFVGRQNVAVTLWDKKPAAGDTVLQFAEFDEARSAAMDALIENIEQAERQLFKLRQSETYEAWLARGAE